MSSDFIYDKGVIIAEQVDGKLIPVAPAPSGDELDLLLDECCICVEQMFKVYGRLDPELQMNDGQHSLVLTDGVTKLDISRGHRGVRSWITEGTLRSSNQLTPVLNGFKASMDAKVRMRKVEPTWKFDNDALIIVSSRFGIDAPRTVAELQAKKATDQLERQRLWRERQEQSQATDAAFKASEAGREKERREATLSLKRDTIQAVVDALATPVWSDLPKITSEMSDEAKDTVARRARGDAQDNAKERRRIEKITRPVVEASPLSAEAIVRIYEEAMEDFVEVSEDNPNCPPFETIVNKRFAKAVAGANQPSEGFGAVMISPLLEGVERHILDIAGLTEFLKTRSNGLHVRVDFANNFVVDVVPESLEETYTRYVAGFDEMQAGLQGARNE